MKGDLFIRISQALDKEGGLEGDVGLQRELAKDQSAALLANQVQEIDQSLKSLPEPRQPDFVALAARIDAAISDEVDSIMPPTFDSDPGELTVSTHSNGDVSSAESAAAPVIKGRYRPPSPSGLRTPAGRVLAPAVPGPAAAEPNPAAAGEDIDSRPPDQLDSIPPEEFDSIPPSQYDSVPPDSVDSVPPGEPDSVPPVVAMPVISQPPSLPVPTLPLPAMPVSPQGEGVPKLRVVEKAVSGPPPVPTQSREPTQRFPPPLSKAPPRPKPPAVPAAEEPEPGRVSFSKLGAPAAGGGFMEIEAARPEKKKGGMGFWPVAAAAAALLSFGAVLASGLLGGEAGEVASAPTESLSRSAPEAAPEVVGTTRSAFSGEGTAIAEAESEAREASADQGVTPAESSETESGALGEVALAPVQATAAPRAAEVQAAPANAAPALEGAPRGGTGRPGTTTMALPATEAPATGAPPSSPEEVDAERARGDLPDTPSREEVQAGLRAAARHVAACGGGARSGTATVNITIGSSGRVRHALVTGAFANTPEGSCIARAVRQARFPEFRRDSISVTYPFPVP